MVTRAVDETKDGPPPGPSPSPASDKANVNANGVAVGLRRMTSIIVVVVEWQPVEESDDERLINGA